MAIVECLFRNGLEAEEVIHYRLSSEEIIIIIILKMYEIYQQFRDIC